LWNSLKFSYTCEISGKSAAYQINEFLKSQLYTYIKNSRAVAVLNEVDLKFRYVPKLLEPIAGMVAQHLEIIPKTLSTYQDSAYEIYE